MLCSRQETGQGKPRAGKPREWELCLTGRVILYNKHLKNFFLKYPSVCI